jgi:FlaA1/EpsC-like NDP-sugar epimerase
MSKPLLLKIFKSFLVLSLTFFLSVHLFSSKAAAQETSSRAYAIKAGFIYNFTKFIKWPPPSKFSSSDNSYNICIIGDNPFGSILDRLEKKHRFKQHPLKIQLDVSQDNFQGCHILFVSFSERFNIEQIVEQTRNLQILTVGDTEGYAERGIDINLLVAKNKVKFEISKQCLDNKGFKVSSELYNLATIVRGGCQ